MEVKRKEAEGLMYREIKDNMSNGPHCRQNLSLKDYGISEPQRGQEAQQDTKREECSEEYLTE